MRMHPGILVAAPGSACTVCTRPIDAQRCVQPSGLEGSGSLGKGVQDVVLTGHSYESMGCNREGWEGPGYRAHKGRPPLSSRRPVARPSLEH